jgi:hypothetical protein
MLVIGGDRGDYEESYASVTEVERVDSPWVMPYERKPIFLCRNRKRPYAADWAEFKRWR